MFYYLKTTLRERWPLFLVVMIILSTIGLGYMGALSVSERMVIQAKDDLDKNWRYQYDILVLPNKNDTSTILGDGWLAPQASISNYGGISLKDVETIREISGVEVAAPISILAYPEGDILSVSNNNQPPGTYTYSERKSSAFNGLTYHTIYDSKVVLEHSMHFGGDEWDPENYSDLSNKLAYENEEENWFRMYGPLTISMRQPNHLMLIAIDPIEENKLYSLNDSLVLGNPLNDLKISKVDQFDLIPVLALADSKVQMTESLTVYDIDVPEGVSESDFGKSATDYLMNLPRSLYSDIILEPFSPEWKYKNVSISLTGEVKYEEQPYHESFFGVYYYYSPIQFMSADTSSTGIPQLKAIPVKKNEYDTRNLTLYRERESGDLKFANFGLNVVDYYVPDEIEPIYKGSWNTGEPTDVYTPQHSMIIADRVGNKVNPTPLIPLPYKDTYYTGSPDLITILDAAKIFYEGDSNFLSSVRVVVDGVEERTNASQQKVEMIAKEIIDKTGLHVEILLGSSASKVHIDLGVENDNEPGIVEEGWQQAGVSWSIQEQIEKSNIVLFIYLLFVGFVFCYTVITHSLLRRSTEFAMLRAIGWSRRKILGSLLVEVFALSLLSLIPIIAANAKLNILDWYQIALVFIIVLPVIGIGYFTGSRKAIKLSPRAGLEGEGTQWKFMRFFSINGLFTYVTHQLMRRPLRFGLLSIVLALTSFMVILFIATQKSLSNFLLLSFLGETIDLNLKGFQTVFLIAGIILTVSIVFLLLYLNITERRGEFFILRSIGWSLQRIQLYMGIEVILVAAVGSIIGGIAAYALLTYFSAIWLPIWLLVATILTPPMLMLIFSLTIVQSMKMKRVVM